MRTRARFWRRWASCKPPPPASPNRSIWRRPIRSAARGRSTIWPRCCEPHLLPAAWLQAGRTRRAPASFPAARQDYAALESEARLFQRHRRSLLDLELDSLLARFTQSYSGWTRVLRPRFHRDMAGLRASLQPGAAVDYAAAVADLQLAVAVRAARQREQAQAETLAARLGPPFEGRATDWDDLQARSIGRTGCSLCRCPAATGSSDGDVDCLPHAQAFISAGGAPAERDRRW